nr:hypothetical protein [Bacteroidota bacterium]
MKIPESKIDPANRHITAFVDSIQTVKTKMKMKSYQKNQIRYSSIQYWIFSIRYSIFPFLSLLRYSIFSIRYSIFLFPLLFLLLFSRSLPAQEWIEPVNISNLSGSCTNPDVVIDHSGIIHVVWSYRIEDNYRKIMYISSADFGETWTGPLDLLQNTDLWMSKPHIGCDSKNYLYVTYDYAVGTPDKMVYMVVYDGHQWSDPILLSEGMPGSHYNNVLIDHNDRIYVFWDYSNTGDDYYRYLENNSWSQPYCPYPGNEEIYALVEAAVSEQNSLHWIGASAGYGYYGERLQYFYYDYPSNSWQEPQMPVQDTLQVGVDITLDNDGVPVCVYRNRPTGNERTKLIQKEGNYWSHPEVVACGNGQHRYQQIAVDQKNDVHIVERDRINNWNCMIHYQKIKDKWSGYIIDSTPNFCNPTKLLFYCNSMFLVYYRNSIPGAPDSDIYFTKYDIVTGQTEQPEDLPDLKVYPNPGKDNIYIEFVALASLLENEIHQQIELSVYDITGKHILTLINKNIPPGVQRIIWNGTDKNGKEVNSGPYLVRLKSGRKT